MLVMYLRRYWTTKLSHPRLRWWNVFLFALLGHTFAVLTAAQYSPPPHKIAVLDMGSTATAQLAVKTIAEALAAQTGIEVLDQTLSASAAHGAGYTGSLNLSLDEARDLGAAIGCEFYFLGDVQTLRRYPSTGPIYFDSYASIFLVSARTGKLVLWDRPSFKAPAAELAQTLLHNELARRIPQYVASLSQAATAERNARIDAIGRDLPVIDDAPDEDTAAAKGFSAPKPYRRFKPEYTADAETAEATATVDVLVDLDANGEVQAVSVARWAGFGLDESTVTTVKRMHFFPAKRDGKAVPVRVLLRYNFRRQRS